MIVEKNIPEGVLTLKALNAAEAERVARIIARDKPAPVRVDTEAYRKRRGETNAQWKARVAELKSLEKPIGEVSITPETASHGDYVDSFVHHAETNTKTQAKRNRMTSSLAAMHDKGQITGVQFSAALEIARVAEMIERAVSIKGQEIRERVDGGGAGIGPLEEKLTLVRLDRAYTKWRYRLPMPKRMIIDMLVQDQALKSTARSYGMGWPKARARLIFALDRWESVKEWAWDNTDEDDLLRVKRQIES